MPNAFELLVLLSSTVGGMNLLILANPSKPLFITVDLSAILSNKMFENGEVNHHTKEPSSALTLPEQILEILMKTIVQGTKLYINQPGQANLSREGWNPILLSYAVVIVDAYID